MSAEYLCTLPDEYVDGQQAIAEAPGSVLVFHPEQFTLLVTMRGMMLRLGICAARTAGVH